jgi:hypothetical protein
MSYRTRIISGCLELVTFLVVRLAEAWLLFALALDRLCRALDRDDPISAPSGTPLTQP